MKWIGLVLALGVFPEIIFSQSSSSLLWGTPISFQDFQAIPDKNDSAAARISVSIGLYQWKSNGLVRFSVKAFMEKSESWMKEKFKDEPTLRHEQGHFDIAQIFALKLSGALKDKKSKAFTGDASEVKKLYDLHLQEMNRFQNRYDSATHGGLRTEIQINWQSKIRNELGRLSDK